jgi:hypothetical protein
MDFPLPLKITITIWKIILFSVSKYSWRKEYPDPKLMLVPCLLGTYTFIRFQAFLIEPGWPIAFIGVLSGLIFCCILFAMNLGHWYLNVHGLPMAPLIRTVNILWILLTIRTVWDIYFMSAGRVSYAGDLITIAVFISKMDGFLLIIGLFFGTLFPLISLYFTREVLRLKNTQSATGILYVILCSIILGDMAYKYYLIKFGVFL